MNELQRDHAFAIVQKTLQLRCKNARGGISSLALSLGKCEKKLANELNINVEQNKLGFMDALQLISLTESVNIAEMIAQSVDCTLMPKPKCGSNTTDLLRDVAKLSATVGKLCGDTAEAVSEDSDLGYEISAKERDTLMESVEHLLSQLVCLKQVLGQ
ncbi:hypothetical protein BKK49_07005 [Rodentibacter rarus]|uniref:phage regulatory CII family protein n=1 Tax=Rodentibacter rarus TaxID=1908260 RepID=UPI0009857FD0|nr:phage regulatory CII family protein [Rodentibacter rarus]OOF39868.1 hypothetical protein BKK49_07005 [Rodentibacter rarus]